MSDAEATAFLADVNSAPLLQAGHWSQIAIACDSDDSLLGDVGIFVDADQARAELGFTLAPAHQGQGFASLAVLEAAAMIFDMTPAKEIIAVTDARNAPSIRLLERVGMVLARSEQVVFCGEPCTEQTYCLPAPRR